MCGLPPSTSTGSDSAYNAMLRLGANFLGKQNHILEVMHSRFWKVGNGGSRRSPPRHHRVQFDSWHCS